MKRSICVCLSIVIVLTLCACSSPPPAPSEQGREPPSPSGQPPSKPLAPAPQVDYTPGVHGINAEKTLQDMYDTWWRGTPEGGNIVKTGWGVPGPPYDEMIWAFAMMTFGIYTYWDGERGEDQAARLWTQYNWCRDNVRNRTGNFGGAPNIAVDDSGWNAMYFTQAYLATGDALARIDALAVIVGAYDFYKDGDTANGLWYPQKPPSQGYDETYGKQGDNRFKSVYSVGLISAALDIMIDAKEREPDKWRERYAQLYTDTMNVYNWNEEHLLRDGPYTVVFQDGREAEYGCSDYLYWCDYSEDRSGRTERTGPDGGSRPNDVNEAGSVSALLGNTGMAVCHALMYRLTGEGVYLERALRTAKAITDSPLYNRYGILVNDRDGWTNGTFMGRYVREVLTLPGIRPEDKELIYKTAESAFENARVEIDGKWYYKADWRGGNKWESIGTKPEQIMTSGSTANIIIAAGLLERIDQENAAAAAAR